MAALKNGNGRTGPNGNSRSKAGGNGRTPPALPILSEDARALLHRLRQSFGEAIGEASHRLVGASMVHMATHLSSDKYLNLALQGGGAHGAFTWGVLDQLLEDHRVRFPAISGTSAGAVNAVALAAGLTEGGRAGARRKLAEVWRAVSQACPFSSLGSSRDSGGGETPSGHIFWLDILSNIVSPYDLAPLDFDPLRDLLDELIDFRTLRRRSPAQLFIAATDVSSGQARIFNTGEINLDVVLASASLPHLRKAVKIGRRHYWDGGYSANPAIMDLVMESPADDTLLVQILPNTHSALPTKPQEITDHVNRITFNEPLRREIMLIEEARRIAAEGISFGGRRRRRLKRHRFHHIEAAKVTEGLNRHTKVYPDWDLLTYLRDGGRDVARAWLRRNYDSVGRRSTLDLNSIAA